MKKMYLVFLPFIATNAIADVNQKLSECAQISNDSKRLACYDQIAKPEKQPEQSSVEAPIILTEKISDSLSAPVTKPTATPTSKVSPSDSAVPSSSPQVTAKPEVAAKAEDLFGKSVEDIIQINSIESTIIGSFRGWKKGAIIKLENGQKWKVVSNSRGYVNLDSPKVTIEKGGFGDFKMKVEGLNAIAKVKRIK